MTRMRRLAIVGAAVAALGAGVTGAASAASVQPNYRSCGHNGSGICTNIKYQTVLYLRSGGAGIVLAAGSGVEVTCWYYGNTSDGYWDHVTWINPGGDAIGHVDDGAVNFNGLTPPQVGLPQC